MVWFDREFLFTQVYLVEIVLVVAVMSYLIAGVLRKTRWRNWVLPVTFLVLVAGTLLSSFNDHALLIVYLVTMLHVASIVGMVLVVVWTARLHGRKFILVPFITGMVLVSLFGAYQYLAQTSPASTVFGLAQHSAQTLGDAVVLTSGGVRVLRSYGTFDHPNIFGGYLVVTLILLIWLTKDSTRQYRHHLYYLSAIPGVLLVWTFSRSAWLALATVGALLAIRFRKQLVQFTKHVSYKCVCHRPGFFAVVVVLAAIVFAWSPVSARLGFGYEHNRLEQMSIEQRLDAFDRWRIIMQQHSSGVGFGAYTIAQMVLTDTVIEADVSPEPVHNSYLLALAELGVIQTMLLVVMILAVIRRLYKQHRLILLGALPLIALMVIGLFDHYLWSLHAGQVLLGFVIGLWLIYQPSAHSMST